MKKPNVQRRHSSVLATIAIVMTLGAFEASVAHEKKAIGAKYGTREPRTCEDTKAPAKGAITADFAAKYLICAHEKQDGPHLYLIENLKVQVGGGTPYAAIIGHRSFPAIDVAHPVYSIRGSFTKYECKDENAEYGFGPGKNCRRYEHQNAEGYCYKTTFGDWRCYMIDTNITNENIFDKVPPPQD